LPDFEKMTDEDLLIAIQDGNHSAFGSLVRRHSGQFFRLAYRFTGNNENAEDVVQECFIKLWERPEIWQVDKNVKFTTWFYRVVVNRSLDLQRKTTPYALHEDFEIENNDLANDEVLIKKQEKIALEKAIALLPKRQRTALNLCFYEELSNQDAAYIMGLNLKALQSLLMRAKGSLKQNMKIIYEVK
jgi:RNA polymerase sigma-70 factor (ECF subfamily)